jgi:hypothetical protein
VVLGNFWSQQHLTGKKHKDSIVFGIREASSTFTANAPAFLTLNSNRTMPPKKIKAKKTPDDFICVWSFD